MKKVQILELLLKMEKRMKEIGIEVKVQQAEKI